MVESDDLERAVAVLSDPAVAEWAKGLLGSKDVCGERGAGPSDGGAPCSVTPETTERLTRTLMYINSQPTVFKGEGAAGSSMPAWTFITHEAHEAIRRIESKSCLLSANYTNLEKHFRAGIPLPPLMEDITIALRRDGYFATYEDVRCGIEGYSEASAAEILAKEVYDAAVEAFFGCEESLKDPASLYGRLMEHAESPNAPVSQRASAYLPEHAMRQAMFEPSALPAYFDCELSKAEKAHLPAVIKVIGLCDELLEYRTFGQVSALMEIVIRSALFRRIGMPSLIGVPLSKLSLDWEERCVPQRLLIAPLGSCTRVGSFGADATLFFRQKIKFCETGLDGLGQIMAKASRESEETARVVENDRRLNLRQQKAVISLLRNRRATYDSIAYQETFDVTAPTARRDLNKLTHLGFLSRKIVGQKLVYSLRPDFRDAFM